MENHPHHSNFNIELTITIHPVFPYSKHSAQNQFSLRNCWILTTKEHKHSTSQPTFRAAQNKPETASQQVYIQILKILGFFYTSDYFTSTKRTGALRRSNRHHKGTTQENPKFCCCSTTTTTNKSPLLPALLATGLEAELDSAIVPTAPELPRTNSNQDSRARG